MTCSHCKKSVGPAIADLVQDRFPEWCWEMCYQCATVEYAEDRAGRAAEEEPPLTFAERSRLSDR